MLGQSSSVENSLSKDSYIQYFLFNFTIMTFLFIKFTFLVKFLEWNVRIATGLMLKRESDFLAKKGHPAGLQHAFNLDIVQSHFSKIFRRGSSYVHIFIWFLFHFACNMLWLSVEWMTHLLLHIFDSQNYVEPKFRRTIFF